MKKVVAESIITLEDSDWEKLVNDVAEHMSKTWVRIESDDDLPDSDDDYLVITENDIGTRRRQVSSFTLYEDGGHTWGIETSPMYRVVAWHTLPPMEDEE